MACLRKKSLEEMVRWVEGWVGLQRNGKVSYVSLRKRRGDRQTDRDKRRKKRDRQTDIETERDRGTDRDRH